MAEPTALKAITGYFNVEPVKLGMKAWKAEYDKLTDADKAELLALILVEQKEKGE